MAGPGTHLNVGVSARFSETPPEAVIDGSRYSVKGITPVDSSWLLPFALFAAMRRQESLHIDGPVSTKLLANCGAAQQILGAWLNLKPIDIVAADCTADGNSNGKVALCFTGGVDSIYSLVIHSQEIDELLFVHGFDIPWNQDCGAIVEQLRVTASEFGKPLRVVATDARKLWDAHANWGWTHGAALASMALAVGYQRVYVASGSSYRSLHPWGSHPLLDHLWSTERTEFIHDGVHLDRLGKLEAIARIRPQALERLRVCWLDTSVYNCGRCEKCLRTMVGLKIADALRHCRSLPQEIDPRLVRRIHLKGGDHFWREFDGLPLPAELRAAIDTVLRNAELRLPPIDGSIRSYLRRGKVLGRRLRDLIAP